MRDITAARTNCPKPRAVWMLPPSLPVVPGCFGALWELRNFIPIFFLSCMLSFRSSDKVIPLRKVLYDRFSTT